jgi:hypothetical protein
MLSSRTVQLAGPLRSSLESVPNFPNCEKDQENDPRYHEDHIDNHRFGAR